MSSPIDPSQSNPMDSHNRYAINTQNSESFKANLKIPGNDHMGYDHAKVLVNQPIQYEAMKMLMGELQQRRWAIFDVPKSSARVFPFELPQFQLDELEELSNRINAIDCTNSDPEEQKLREQEKSVLQAFCSGQIDRQKNYITAKLRIVEFLQG